MKKRKYAASALTLLVLVTSVFFVSSTKVQASSYSDCVQEAEDQGLDASHCQGLQGDPGLANDDAEDACAGVDGIGGILCTINQLLGDIVPILIALGLIYFIWGVVQYVIGGDTENKKKGRDHIIYGLIGLAVIIGVWGFVSIIVNTFGLEGDVPDVSQIVPVADEERDCSDLSSMPRPKVQDLLCYATSIISDAIIPLIFALAVAAFLWGVVQFVINGDDEAKKTKGKQFMLWGIIGLAVMVSIWGLVTILGDTFGIDTVIPQVRP